MSTPSLRSPTGTLVTEVVPVQVDLPELLAIDASTGFRAFRVVAVRDEEQRLPSGLEVLHELPRWRAEHERARTE